MQADLKKSRIVQEDLNEIVKGISKESHKLSGKTVLITGGAGFLGKFFLLIIDKLNKEILDKPCKVISIDNFITGSEYLIEPSINFKSIQHDVSKPIKIDEPIDFIVHAAGIASPKFYRKFIIETIDVGVLGTKNMLELAKEKKVQSMLFFSSSEVYGDPDPQFVPTPETYFGNVSCIGPRSNYDESKRLGETLCIAYHQVHKVPVKMVRPFNVFGPGMRMDDYRVIPNFVSHAMRGEPIPVYGPGNNTRTFCYVTDGIVGFFKALLSDCNGEPFNIGNEDDEINMSALADLVAGLFGNSPKISHIEGPTDAYAKADPRRRCPDLTKAKSFLEYNSKVQLKIGVKRFIDWAKDNAVS
jgi:UDP-glucuronate decarboxylase